MPRFRSGPSRRRLLSTLGAVGALVGALGLAACAETTAVVHSSKLLNDGSGGGGGYKVGAPYQVNGAWYTPREDYRYREEGEASWYGPGFQGKQTANGEIFDMNKMTAAHPTLPMPSYVQVTNLENGRRVTVKVNDRGPFASDRIIDVSRAAARALGFEQQGRAQVQVAILPRESRVAKSQALSGQQVADVPPPRASRRAGLERDDDSLGTARTPQVRRRPMVTRPARAGGGSGAVAGSASGLGTPYVQVGAFADRGNAQALARSLSRFGPTLITPASFGDHVLYRVRLGPFATINQAFGALRRVQGAGHPQARLIGG